jgi:hypothetical protein
MKLRLNLHRPQFDLGFFEATGVLGRRHGQQEPESFQSHFWNLFQVRRVRISPKNDDANIVVSQTAAEKFETI